MATTSTSKPRERDYKGDDSTLIQRSRTVIIHLTKYLSQFSAFDIQFSAAFIDDWKNQIDVCEKLETDESMDDELRQYTANAEDAKNLCFKATDELNYYVKKAFPNNLRVQREFGFNQREKMRAQTFNVVLWIAVMGRVADSYTTELSNAGMSNSVVTDLQNAGTNYYNKEVDQEAFKRTVLRSTRERIEKMNKLYSYLHRTHEAAQQVFFKDKEIRSLFDLNLG